MFRLDSVQLNYICYDCIFFITSLMKKIDWYWSTKAIINKLDRRCMINEVFKSQVIKSCISICARLCHIIKHYYVFSFCTNCCMEVLLYFNVLFEIICAINYVYKCWLQTVWQPQAQRDYIGLQSSESLILLKSLHIRLI